MTRSPRSRPGLAGTLAKHKKAVAASALVLSTGLGGGIYLLAARQTPEGYLAKAVQLERAGDVNAATIELKNALQLAPDNAEARFRLGRLHLAGNDYAGAEKELRHALGKGYADPELPLLLARALLAQAEPRKVLEEIRERPGAPAEINAPILALRAQAQLMLDDPAAAARSLAAAEALAPEHPDTLALRARLAIHGGQAPERALELVEQALAKAERRADLWVMKAELLRAARHARPEVLASYGKALAIEPANIPARLATVQILMEAGDLDRAEAELKLLAKYAPNNVLGRYLAALADYRRERLDDANNKLQSVLNAAPNFVPGNLLAGLVNQALGKPESATGYLRKVLDLEPENPAARKLLATTLLSSGQTEQAQALLAELKANDNDPLLLGLQGNIALRQGHYQEARQSLEKAVRLAPDNLPLMRELVASRMASGDEAGALAALTQMAELDKKTSQAEVMLATTHLKAKRYDAALQAVAAMERKLPGQPLAENLRGVIHLARKDPAQARASFAKALALDPGYFPAAANLARLDLGANNPTAARARFQELLKHAPDSSQAWLALAELARLDKNEAEYLADLRQAARANAKDAQPRLLLARYWLSKGDAAKALSEARGGLDATGRPEFLDAMGMAYLMQKDRPGAISSFTKWAEARPKLPLAHFKLAQVLQADGNREAALKALDQALRLEPKFLEASLLKAVVLADAGRVDEALKLARALQAQQPQSPAGLLAEAEVQMRARKPVEAAQAYAKAARVSKRGDLLTRAQQAYAAAGQAKAGEDLLRQWLATTPGDAPVRHQLASALMRGGDLKGAAEHYATLAQANPKDLVALNNLAWLYGELNDPRAAKVGEQAYRLSPDSAAALDTLGWILARGGDPKRAVELLQKAHQRAPDQPEIHWHYAVALARAGDKTQARTELASLFDTGRDFRQINEARQLQRSLQ